MAPAVGPPAQPVPMAAPAPVAPPAVAAPVVSEPPARAAAPSFAASDSEIANKVRELIARKQLERIAPRKNERDAIDAFYVKNRNAMPLWFANGQPSERTRDAVGASARHRCRRPRSRRVFAAGCGIER